jgi:FkbM family methyltransferase
MAETLLRRARRKLLGVFLRRVMVRRAEGEDLIRLGSGYGGWWIPSTAAHAGATVLSAGVGEDTTFDEELLARGCEVWGVDPTPRAREHVAARTGALGERFHFLPVGLWSSDDTLRFYAPADPAHVSHSVVNAQRTDTFFEAECWSLPHLIEEMGGAVPEIVKLDIEGAEVDVLRAMLADGLRPAVLCVELDTPLPEHRTLGLLRDLRRAGYRLAHAEAWNLLLLAEAA